MAKRISRQFTGKCKACRREVKQGEHISRRHSYRKIWYDEENFLEIGQSWRVIGRETWTGLCCKSQSWQKGWMETNHHKKSYSTFSTAWSPLIWYTGKFHRWGYKCPNRECSGWWISRKKIYDHGRRLQLWEKTLGDSWTCIMINPGQCWKDCK